MMELEIKHRRAINYNYNRTIKKLLTRFNEEKPISYKELLQQNTRLKNANNYLVKELDNEEELSDHLRGLVSEYRPYLNRYQTTLKFDFQIYDKNDEDDKCSICLDGILKNQYIFITPCCTNKFHSQCILRIAPLRCPLCKDCIGCHYSSDSDSDSSDSDD